MSKYAALRDDLQARPRVDTELSFAEIEKILGFELPPSALEHNAWWANERGTHVQARAWMDAGWQVWRVRRSEKKVYFSPCEAAPSAAPSGVNETAAPFLSDEHVITIQKNGLRGAAIQLLEDYCEENGGNIGDAVVNILNDLALARRRRLIDWVRGDATFVPGDSTDIIREARDAR